MFDRSHAYHYEIQNDSDDDDLAPIIPLRPRTSTDDLTMQVRIADIWHRKMADIDETACEIGFRLNSEQRTRREQLTNRDGELCSACFTSRERRRANENDVRSDQEEKRRKQRETIDGLFKSLSED